MSFSIHNFIIILLIFSIYSEEIKINKNNNKESECKPIEECHACTFNLSIHKYNKNIYSYLIMNLILSLKQLMNAK